MDDLSNNPFALLTDNDFYDCLASFFYGSISGVEWLLLVGFFSLLQKAASTSCRGGCVSRLFPVAGPADRIKDFWKDNPMGTGP